MKNAFQISSRARGFATAAAALASIAAAAAWKPVGELQAASDKVMGPQLQLIASKANFALLPMLVPQIKAQTEMAQKFGIPPSDAEFGVKFMVDPEKKDKKFSYVFVWPLGPGGAEKWRTDNASAKTREIEGVKVWRTTMKMPDPANPTTAKQTKGYVAVSADGKWAFMGENAGAAAAASKTEPFAKPIKTGLAAISIHDSQSIDLFIEEAKSLQSSSPIGGVVASASGNGISLLPDGTISFDDVLLAIAGEVESAYALLSASNSGLDLRISCVPRKGGTLAAPGGAKLPADAFEFKGVPANTVISYVGVPADRKGKIGQAFAKAMDKVCKEIPAHFDKLLNQNVSSDSRDLLVFFNKSFAAIDGFRKSEVPCSCMALSLAEGEDGKKNMAFSAKTAGAPSFGVTAPAGNPESSLPFVFSDKNGELKISGVEKDFKDDAKSGKTYGESFVEAFPEVKIAKHPLWALCWRVGFGAPGKESQAVFLRIMGFGYRGKTKYNAILRIPGDDLASIFQSMIKVSAAPGGDDEEDEDDK